MSYPWFRFYTEALTDRKIERICRNTGEPKVVVIGAWAIILALANDSPQRGLLLLTDDIPVSVEDIAADLGLEPERAGLLVHQFVRLQLLTENNGILAVSKWDSRQFKSDSSTARTRKYREERVAELEVPSGDEDNEYANVTGTSQDRHCSGPDTDTDTEHNAAIAGDAAPPKKAKNPSKRDASKAMFGALAGLCQIDWHTARNDGAKGKEALRQSEKILRDAGALPSQLGAAATDKGKFAEWWYTQDWRGKQGQPPTPAQVRDEWGQFVAWIGGGGQTRPYSPLDAIPIVRAEV